MGKGKATEKESEHTYNGVGKSLLLFLVNFCLGSDPKPQLAEKLPQWSFSLEFKIGANSYIVTRTTADQDTVLFGGTELKLGKFRDWLEARVFQLPKHSSRVERVGGISQSLNSKAAGQAGDGTKSNAG